jgi:polygalacturonase
LVTWYAAEELAEADLAAAVGLLKRARIPLIREFMARRIAALGSDRPVVNVVSIGAKADGTTDDSAAFQTAIDRIAKTGGRILVPWGVHPYRIARPLVVSSDHVEFWGPGARLQFSDGAGLTAQGPLRELALRGLRIEGGGAGSTLQFRGATEVELEDLQVKGGASIAGAGRLAISSSRFDALEIAMPESGGAAATLRGMTVSRTFRLTGDCTQVRLDGCSLPSK